MRTLLLALALTGCVHGKDAISVTDPEYAVLCVDSTLVDTTKVCWPEATIQILVPNPNR